MDHTIKSKVCRLLCTIIWDNSLFGLRTTTGMPISWYTFTFLSGFFTHPPDFLLLPFPSALEEHLRMYIKNKKIHTRQRVIMSQILMNAFETCLTIVKRSSNTGMVWGAVFPVSGLKAYKIFWPPLCSRQFSVRKECLSPEICETMSLTACCKNIAHCWRHYLHVPLYWLYWSMMKSIFIVWAGGLVHMLVGWSTCSLCAMFRLVFLGVYHLTSLELFGKKKKKKKLLICHVLVPCHGPGSEHRGRFRGSACSC